MPEDKAIKLELASQFENEGKDLHALQIYSSLLTDSEYSKTAHLKTAEIYDRMSKPQAAANILKQYIVQEPEDYEIFKLLGEYLIEKSFNEEALEVLSLIPREENSDIYFLMGLANYNSGEYEIACLNFEEFNRHNLSSPLVPESYLYLAKSKYFLHLFDESLSNLQKAENLATQSFEIYHMLSKVYYSKKMFFHAGEYLSKAFRLDPESTELNLLAGNINYNLGNYEEAEKYLTEALNTEEPTAEVHILLGLIYRRLNRIDESKSHLEKALIIDPQNAVALREISK